MSDLVAASDIERIVGVERHSTAHYARSVTAERRVYVLHSHECRDSGIDLRECPYSLALDRGIEISAWAHDRPVVAAIAHGRLVSVEEEL